LLFFASSSVFNFSSAAFCNFSTYKKVLLLLCLLMCKKHHDFRSKYLQVFWRIYGTLFNYSHEKMNSKFWSRNHKGTNMKIILQWILGKWDGKVWTGFIWFRTGTSGRLL
jgi:hypothetical protein